MLTPEGEEIASDGAAHKSWMPVVEKVPNASCGPGLEMNTTDTPPEPRTILLASQRHLLVSFDPPAEDWRGSLLEGTVLPIQDCLSALVLVLGMWF